MGMKRFSAPPALHPTQKPSSDCQFPADSSAGPGGGGGQGDSGVQQHKHQQQRQQHLHRQINQHHQHQQSDWNSKRVRTEQTFEWLLDKNQHSDVTIVVNDDEGVFHVHRVVLQHKSDVFAQMIAKTTDTCNAPDIQVTGSSKIVLHVQEDGQCSGVFSRFLYFLYSGAVWLHQDYVLPLFRLANKYRVAALMAHCQAYLLQILAKSCNSASITVASSSASSNRHHNHMNNNVNNQLQQQHDHSPCNTLTSTSPNGNTPLPNVDAMSPNGNTQAPQLQPYAGSGFPLDVVCDLFEDEAYGEGDIKQTAYRLLCCQFRQLVKTERWLLCRAGTVCRLLASDGCAVEESLILQAATDYMKRNTLADKQQIQDILALVRYPRLQRRVLYHLHKSGSFHNFPHIQQLMLNAVKFHSFKDLPEAKQDFVGAQFRPRLGLAGSGASSNNVVVSGISGSGGVHGEGVGGGGEGDTNGDTSPNRPASVHVASALTTAVRLTSSDRVASLDRMTSSDHFIATEGHHHQRHKQHRHPGDLHFDDELNHLRRHSPPPHHQVFRHQHHQAADESTATAMTQTVHGLPAFPQESEYPPPVTITPRFSRHSQV